MWYDFRILFRWGLKECVSEYGYKIEAQKHGKEQETNNEYCQVKNASIAPEISNEFVSLCLDQPGMNMDAAEIIFLTLNFCNWLLSKKLTKFKITLDDWFSE